MENPDVLVVGAGSAGCVVAARLSQDPTRRVLLLEPGALHVHDWPPELLDASVIPAGHAETWQHATGGLRLHRGRVVGGSGAVNGAYFVRATPTDVDAWPHLDFATLLPAFVRSEDDPVGGRVHGRGGRVHGRGGPVHGRGGPVPVTRATELQPISAAFRSAARAAGFDDEPDKNAGGPAGVGPLPVNVRDGVRVNAALAYLLPALGRANLEVRPGVEVHRVLLERGRAVGVELVGGAHVRAEQVVLCAGAIGSAEILLRSGVGPGLAHELPVGLAFSDHPDVAVPVAAGAEGRAGGAPVRAEKGVLPIEVVLNTPDVELRCYTAGFDRLVPGSGAGPQPGVGVALMTPDNRGTLTLAADGTTVIDHRYLASARDRDVLADGVRLAHHLAGTREPDDVDAWVRANLGTSQHLCGTTPLGAVLGPDLDVLGIERLHVVDAGAIPVVPTRGPHASVIALAEHAVTRFAIR